MGLFSPDYIKSLRIKYGYKSYNFADWLNITPSSYGKKENGLRDFTINEILIILKKVERFHPDFNCPIDFLSLKKESINKFNLRHFEIHFLENEEELFLQACEKYKVNPTDLLKLALFQMGIFDKKIGNDIKNYYKFWNIDKKNLNTLTEYIKKNNLSIKDLIERGIKIFVFNENDK